MRYTWILFDLDGTLFDYEKAERAALEAAWSSRGLSARTDLLDSYRVINGALWKSLEGGTTSADEIKVERFTRLLQEFGLTTDPSELSYDYLLHLGRQTQLLPGADALLDRLAPSKRLGLITNGLADVQRPRLRRSAIGRHFEILVISEEVGFAKPDARIFAAALDQMGRPPKESVLMVGDNLVADIDGANHFGLSTCWLNLEGRHERGESRPTHEIHHLSQLQQLLEG